MKRLLLLLIFLVLPTLAQAQTGTVEWVQNNVASAQQAMNFGYALAVQPFGALTPGAPVVLTGVTCTMAPASLIANCTAPLPPSALNALVTGAKSTLETTDPSTGLKSGPSAPFSPGPSVPAALRVKP